MTDRTATRLALWALAFRTLLAPVLLLLTAIGLLLFDNIIDPPGDPQGTSGIAGVLVSISLGLGLDKLKGKL